MHAETTQRSDRDLRSGFGDFLQEGTCLILIWGGRGISFSVSVVGRHRLEWILTAPGTRGCSWFKSWPCRTAQPCFVRFTGTALGSFCPSDLFGAHFLGWKPFQVALPCRYWLCPKSSSHGVKASSCQPQPIWSRLNHPFGGKNPFISPSCNTQRP